ncbi:MAG: hypothetical protein K6B52_07350 [Clostridiales bacterium]|nr:hypothetical protein [Clostridiales bacterium]
MLEFKLTADNSPRFVFSCFDSDGSAQGECVFDVNGYETTVYNIRCEDEIIAEGLLRSSLNFAAGRNSYIAFYKSVSHVLMAERIGFKPDKNGLQAEIPDILMHCACGH